MDYVLTTNCLDKRYRNFQALNGLTMHIPKGLFMDLLGKTVPVRRLCSAWSVDYRSLLLAVLPCMESVTMNGTL